MKFLILPALPLPSSEGARFSNHQTVVKGEKLEILQASTSEVSEIPASIPRWRPTGET